MDLNTASADAHGGAVPSSASKRCERWWPWVAAVLVVGGLLRVLPRLASPVWQDEAATLLLFASGDAFSVFTDYALPNNHMLLSAVLAALWSPGSDPLVLRWLMLGIFGLSLVLTWAVGRRVVGAPAALLGLALFAASALTPAFALQLRGYAFSWPWVLIGLLAAHAYLRTGSRIAALTLTLSATASLLILPTNLLATVLAVLLAAGLVQRDAVPGLRRRLGIALVLASIGCAWYGVVWSDVLAHATRRWSDWSRFELLTHWTVANLGQFLWACPLLVLALWQASRRRDDDGRRLLLLVGVLTGVTVGAVLLTPALPFPRNLLPTLPLVVLVTGAVLAAGLAQHATWCGHALTPWCLGFALVLFGIGQAVPACGGWWPGRARSADLCGQFYHTDYAPALASRALQETADAYTHAVMLDTEASWALAILHHGVAPAGLRLLDFRQWSRHEQAPPRLVLAVDAARVYSMLDRIGLGRPTTLHERWSTGYFKLHELGWPEHASPPTQRAAAEALE